jgi:hypothetical protein
MRRGAFVGFAEDLVHPTTAIRGKWMEATSGAWGLNV